MAAVYKFNSIQFNSFISNKHIKSKHICLGEAVTKQLSLNAHPTSIYKFIFNDKIWCIEMIMVMKERVKVGKKNRRDTSAVKECVI